MTRAWGDRVGLAFAVLYLGLLLAMPFGQTRYFIPLAPLLLAGVWRGLTFALRPFSVRRPGLASAAVGAIALLLAATTTLELLTEPPRGRLETLPAARELFDAVRSEQARAPQRIVFARPLVLILETGASAMPAFYATPPAAEAELRRRCITLLALGWPGRPSGALRALNGLVIWRAHRFERIWSNDTFRLYRFDPGEECRGRLRRP